MANKVPKCIAPWVYLDILPDGNIVPCCNNPTEFGNLKTQSLEEIWNSDRMKQFRIDMLGDSLPESCKACDKVGETTLRDYFNEKFSTSIAEIDASTNPDGSIDNIKFKGINFRISNKCNFKCRTCWSKLSSSINFETRSNNLGTYYEQPILNITDYFDFKKLYQDNIDNLELIEFSGGEVLLMDEHYELLQFILDNNKQSQIEIRYDTNFSNLEYSKYNILDFWTKWDPEKLFVNISFDEIGVRGEYIRYGMVWNTFSTNVKKLTNLFESAILVSQNPDRFFICAKIVVSVFNVYRIPEILSYLLDIKFISGEYKFCNFKLVLEGGMDDGIYDIDLYPLEIRERIKEKLLNFSDTFPINLDGELTPIIQKLNSDVPPDKEKIRMFLDKTNKLDQVRNQNFLKVIPELQCLVDYVN